MKTLRLAMALALCLLAAMLRAGAADNSAPKPVLLLTGFEPFGGLKINVSWEIAKSFDGKEIDGYTIKTALLPVVYDEMAKPLREAIESAEPKIVISMGVGTKIVQIETIARNGYHPLKPRDNKNKPPPREEIEPAAPREIPTALPAHAIVKDLKNEHIGSGISIDAGGYLCNECFYRLMRNDAKLAARGFIHLPDFGTKDPEGGEFDQAKLQKAVVIAIKATISSLKIEVEERKSPYTVPPKKPDKRDDE